MASSGTKRDRNGNALPKHQDAAAPRGRFHGMFETFRDELDEHYDRRERIVKASRDVTALSKKMHVLLFLHKEKALGHILTIA